MGRGGNPRSRRSPPDRIGDDRRPPEASRRHIGLQTGRGCDVSGMSSKAVGGIRDFDKARGIDYKAAQDA